MIVATVEGCLVMAGLQVLVTFAPVYILKLGGTEEQVGLLASVPYLINTLALLLSANRPLTSVQALRRSVWSAGAHRFLMGAILFAPLLGKGAPLWVIVTYSLASGAMSLSSNYWTAAVSDMFPPNRRGRLFGIRGVYTGLTGFAATLAAGYLLDALRFPLNFTVTYTLATGVASAAIYFLARLEPPAAADDEPGVKVPVTPRRDRRTQPNLFASLGSLWGGAARGDFLRVTVPLFLFNMGFFGLAPVVNIYFIERLGFSNSVIGLLMSAYMVSQVAGSLVWGALADRFGHPVIAFAALVGMATQAAAFWLVPSVAYLLVIQVLGGFCFAGVVLGTFNMIIAIGGARDRSLAVTWVNVFANFAAFVGPLVGTAVLLHAGFIPAFMGAALMRALGAVALWRAAGETWRSRPHRRLMARFLRLAPPGTPRRAARGEQAVKGVG